MPVADAMTARTDKITDKMTDRPQNLTLELIGKLANVSRSTVSRVLNDHPDVRPEVRTRVEAVIEETGYLPNRAARALVSSRTDLIGLVMPTDVDELFGDPYYSALVHGIQEGCSDGGSIFSIFPIYEKRGETATLATLTGRGFVDGVIVTAGPGSERLVAAFRDRHVKMVVVGHPADDEGLQRVDVENRRGSASAVAHLSDLGRRRIAFIGPPPDFRYSAERLSGYRDGLVSAGLDLADDLVHFEEPTFEGGYRATVATLTAQPDAIHAATDAMAIGAIAALRQHSVRVPDDIAIVGFDGLSEPTSIESLSTVVQPVEAVGRTAVELLLSDRDEPEVVVLPTTLRIGTSSAGADPGSSDS